MGLEPEIEAMRVLAKECQEFWQPREAKRESGNTFVLGASETPGGTTPPIPGSQAPSLWKWESIRFRHPCL